MTWLFSAIVFFIVIFLMTANFSRREKAVGFLVAEPQIIRVGAPRSGRVQEIRVSEGQHVKKGDVLLVIDPDPTLVNGRPSARVEIENIAKARAEIAERIEIIKTQSSAKQQEIGARIDAVLSQMSALQAGLVLQKRTIELISDQLATGTKLVSSGSISTVELQRRETSLQDARLNEQTLLYTAGQNEALIAELRGQLRQIPIEAELKISELKQALLELGQREADANGKIASQIIASTDGVVDTLLTNEGQNIEGGATIISILPEATTLFAEMYVPSKAIVFVEEEQNVRIAYDAFPFTKYGFAEGKVRSVANTVLRPDEIRKPVSPIGPTFRVLVELERQDVISDGKTIRLRPGLTLNADIVTERQSLASWILRSVVQLWARV